MPSCTRAPPESLMKTNGVPCLSAGSQHLGDLVGVHLAGGAAGHREVLAGDVDGRPSTAPLPVTTPSAGMSALSMPKGDGAAANSPISWKLPGSIRASMRSRAVSLPCACCFSMRSSPPPGAGGARLSSSSSTRSLHFLCCLLATARPHALSTVTLCSRPPRLTLYLIGPVTALPDGLRLVRLHLRLGYLPTFFGPSARAREEAGGDPREHRVGEYILVAAVEAVESAGLGDQVVPLRR